MEPVKSQNFEFLRERRAILADLAGFAERYAHSDPAGSLVKQRSFVEQAVWVIYDRFLLPVPTSENLGVPAGSVGQEVERAFSGELSAAAKAVRAPLRSEELIEARHDRVHRDPGRARAARTVRSLRRGPA